MQTKAITIGGLSLLIGPTPVFHLADVEVHFAANTITSKDGRLALITACFHGIRRTRKECPEAAGITLEWLLENVDIETASELFTAFTEVNTPKSSGEPVPGEAQAGASS